MNRINHTWQARKEAITRRIPEKGSFAWIMMMMGLAAIPLILLPFTFWYMVWHGSSLQPDEIQSALAEPLRPGNAGAILLRMGERISRGDKSTAQWYPRIVQLAQHESPQLRRTVAWAMGKDLQFPDFRKTLHTLLRDPDPRVRRAAAISLAQGGDPASREALLEAIAPQAVRSGIAGSVRMRIQPADTATADTAVALVGDTFVEAGIAGTVKRLLVKDGDLVSRDQALLEMIAPPEELVDALRALTHTGNSADVAAVRKCAEEVTGQYKDLIQTEAERTIRAISKRSPSGTGVANNRIQ